MVILVVLLKVAGQFINFSAKDSDLYVGRAGVLVVSGGIFDDRSLYALGKHDFVTLAHLDF